MQNPIGQRFIGIGQSLMSSTHSPQAVTRHLDVPSCKAARLACKMLHQAVDVPAAPLTIPTVSWVANLPDSKAALEDALAGAAPHATVLVNMVGHLQVGAPDYQHLFT